MKTTTLPVLPPGYRAHQSLLVHSDGLFAFPDEALKSANRNLVTYVEESAFGGPEDADDVVERLAIVGLRTKVLMSETCFFAVIEGTLVERDDEWSDHELAEVGHWHHSA